MNKADLVEIRDGTAGDRNFIFSTWLKGLRYGNDWFGLIQQDCYYKAYHAVIERILSAADVKVACLKEDKDVILGYSVSRSIQGNVVLDFVFVKSAWRGIGIGRSLIPSSTVCVTHLTKVGRSMLEKRPTVLFNPFL